MTPTSSAAVAAPTALLLNQARVRVLLNLPEVSDLSEVEPPHPGNMKLWLPGWDLHRVLTQLPGNGLDLRENIHLRGRPFAGRSIEAGYATVVLMPPRNGGNKFRKPDNLKKREALAPLSVLLMAQLLHYQEVIELFSPGVWLITSDKVNDKHVCLHVGDGAFVVELHDFTRISHADHGCALTLS